MMKSPFRTEEESESKRATSLMMGVLSAVDSANAGDGEGGHGDDANATTDENGDLKNSDGNMDNIPKPKIDFLKDNVKEMTYGRRIALKLMDKPWYNPMCKEDEKDGASNNPNSSVEEEEDRTASVIDDFDEDVTFEKPCLEKGWAFFEHQSLYRFILPEGAENEPKRCLFTRIFRTLFMHRNKKFQKAEPGEDDAPSRLYPSFVPHKQMGDFGLGIGLYFSNLRALIFITLICGFISLGNLIYYASDEYDNVGYDGNNYLAALSLKASAACSSQDWVPCPDCKCQDPETPAFDLTWNVLRSNRCANFTSSDGTEFPFALKNTCDGTKLSLAATNFATVIFMVISSLLLGMLMRREEVKFDEDEQTAQDYSVRIKNPPNDANDPEEWRRFFNENFDGAQVIVCTCAVDNDLLVKALVERREMIRSIHSLRPGHSLDILDLTKSAAEIERSRNLFGRLKAKAVPGMPEHVDRLVALNGRIEGRSQLKHSVSNVFVTFETEEGQRRVLENLSVGYTKAKNNDASALSDCKYLFRGELVLDVCEPEEPSTIRWQDLNAGLYKIMKEQLCTTVWTVVALVVVSFAIYYINKLSAAWATYSISIFNVLFPRVAKLLTNNLETHASESNKQASLYYKIVLFRWVSTALIFYVIIPFTEIISYGKIGLLKRIYLQFESDIVIGNLVPLLDPLGHIKRHFLAPRAKSQESMNLLFRGSPYELAERYTDMTKILFLCLFYSAIFPMSFFLCAISLTFKYFVDRFNMVRTWERAPALGPVISSVSRKYFMSLAVGIMAIVCSYYWTGFPYDNLCLTGSSSYVGTFTLSNYTGHKDTEVTVTGEDDQYEFCNMDFTVGKSFAFPFVPTQKNDRLEPFAYMNADQITSTTYFGWSAIAILILVFCKYLYILVSNILIKTGFSSGYKAIGKSQGIAFSEVDSRSAYIPQVSSDVFAFPLIACRIDDIDQEMFDFKDPDRSYKYYDLTMDAKKLLAAQNITDPPCFTIVKTWAPEKND